MLWYCFPERRAGGSHVDLCSRTGKVSSDLCVTGAGGSSTNISVIGSHVILSLDCKCRAVSAPRVINCLIGVQGCS
jgi:hypothetical protein